MAARRAEQVDAAGHLYELRHPVACGHQWLDPLDAGDRRATGDAARAAADPLHTLPQTGNQRVAPLADVERFGHAPYVAPDVGERVRLKRDDARARADHFADGGLNVLEADGADFALRLRDDVRGLQAFKPSGVHAVDAQGFFGKGFDAAIYFVAAAFDIELRRRQLRQPLDGGRVVRSE